VPDEPAQRLLAVAVHGIEARVLTLKFAAHLLPELRQLGAEFPEMG
jgi:hypothetical protein